MNAWIEGASAYCCGAAKGFANNPVWTSNPIHAPYAQGLRDACARTATPARSATPRPA